MARNLLPKQLAFVTEYLVDLNATQAAIRAGYSPKTAMVIGYENLQKPQIQEGIARAMQERAEKARVTVQDVLESIVSIRGRAMESDKLSEALKANELIGKHLGMFTPQLDDGGKPAPVKVEIVVRGADV